jgi:hypothetical protein
MARVIRLGDIGDYANTQMEKLLRASVLETDTLLKSASPVDTGRFRASWQVGENATSSPSDYQGNEGGPNANIPPMVKINYQNERLGNVYSVHNNLPYAERLATASTKDGRAWSKQANAGWVQGIAKDVQGRVIAAAARIGRES